MKFGSNGLVLTLLASLTAVGCQSLPKTESSNVSSLAGGTTRATASADWEKNRPLAISQTAFIAASEPFESHSNYLSLSTPFAPVRTVFGALQEREGVKLKSRGEAHVTVITPPEFKVLSQSGVRMGEIEKIAFEAGLSRSDLSPVCLGMGQALVGSKIQRTYFVVVRSETLLMIRRRVEALAIQKAGRPVEFEADHFYPHITVGFTKDDLHEYQGVIKGRNSCLYPLDLSP